MTIKACSKLTKNCVSTVNEKGGSSMNPITYSCSASEAMNHLRNVLFSMKGAEIAEQGGTQLHAVFTSDKLKFKDDVHFELDDKAKSIHFKSSSRTGYYDFGVNRRRMEEIEERFKKESGT
ncbi:DUF1499 domain-containing protein [Metabacillus indicus]|uniref:DUF1499 domain-containing protein n=1 Tax=Metabacillus indicus TaxID=246786 RepID=UPI002A09051B|nr:DUF1499 domain-containing protein [Metabacillus indicus]MDX8291287.1 DUF1499 domain-containing protein [Metabacillus indicus]